MIDTSEGPQGVMIKQVQLTDLEDTAHCPPPKKLIGLQLRNSIWRSPEARAGGPMQKPSDIFAFAIISIYAVTKAVIFHVDEAELSEDDNLLAIVLERQLSSFGDTEAFNGFLDHLRWGKPEHPWIEIFQACRSGFSAESPRQPFHLWQHIKDEDFKDLIMKMANFDPRKRITAREALEHKWFKNV